MYVNDAKVTEGRGRRRHSTEFKARLVGECRQSGMSVARVARDNGVNANLLHQWIVFSRAPDVSVPAVSQAADAFVPVQISPRVHAVLLRLRRCDCDCFDLRRYPARFGNGHGELADRSCCGMRRLVECMAALIRIGVALEKTCSVR